MLYVEWDWIGMVIIGHRSSKSTFVANHVLPLSLSKYQIAC